MIVLKFFRIPSEANYEAIRLELDAEWGHGPGTGTDTCVNPAAVAPRDAQGRILLAVDERFLGYPAVAARLPALLAAGVVEEIDEATYIPVEPPLQTANANTLPTGSVTINGSLTGGKFGR
jgi:hypothetical protein